MSEKIVSQTLGNTALNLDPSTLADIIHFIRTFLGESGHIETPKIYACAAIVCECKRIPTVGSQGRVRNGVTVEKIMSCVKETSKEDFLTLINILASRWPNCPKSLHHKIDQLRVSYRMFKKYRRVSQNLGDLCQLDNHVAYSLSTLLWLVFLTALMRDPHFRALDIKIHLLSLLLVQVFAHDLKLLNPKTVLETVSGTFGPIPLTPQISEHCNNHYKWVFSTIMKQAYEMRSGNSQFQQIIDRPQIIVRIIDDLSSEYCISRQHDFPNLIDEVSFLNLSKNLTPEVFRYKPFQLLNTPIHKKINFDQERNTNAPYGSNNSIPSEESQESESRLTPLSEILKAMAWIRSCIESLKASQIDNVKKVYEVMRKTSYKLFLDQVNEKLEASISHFTPTCRDFDQRKTQIFKFYTCLMNTIINKSSAEEIANIYSSEGSILSILSLSTIIFNFCYQAKVRNFKEYCQIFGVSLISGFEPINWFGHSLSLPYSVSEHLFELERKLLIQEIWTEQTGILIVTGMSLDSSEKTIQPLALRRLKYHINNRIHEICNQTVGNYICQKSIKLVKSLMFENTEIVGCRKIDQIILCSLFACLSTNPDSGIKVEKVLEKYRGIPLSYQSNLSVICSGFQQKSLLSYYNEEFIGVLEQMMRAEKIKCLTEVPRKINEEEDLISLGASVHHEEASEIFKKKPKKLELKQTYQQKLVKNIVFSTGKQGARQQSKSDSSEMIDESEEPSHRSVS